MARRRLGAARQDSERLAASGPSGIVHELRVAVHQRCNACAVRDAEETSGTPRPPMTVVGAGHSFISYDRVGPRVLVLLSGRFGGDVELCEIGTTGLGLLDHLHAQRLLVVVDACIFGGPPGQVREVVPDLDAPPPPSTSVHQIGPIETLFVARHVSPELLPERTLLVLVETEGIDDATEARACAEVVAIIEREISAQQKVS